MNSTATTLPDHNYGNSHSKRSWVWGPIGVFKLELVRTLPVGRIITWIAMALFPPTLIAIASWQIGRHSAMGSAELNLGFSVMLFILIPQIVIVLGLLLWATPIVHSELEAQTWVYAVVRLCFKCSI